MRSQEGSRRSLPMVQKRLRVRYRAERRFRLYGAAAVGMSLLFLAFLFVSIVSKGFSAFWQAEILLDIYFDPETLTQGHLSEVDYPALIKRSLSKRFPDVRTRRALYALVSSGAAFELQRLAEGDPDLIGKTLPVWLPADDDVDMLLKGRVDRSLPEQERRLTDRQLAWIDALIQEERLKKRFNRRFFTSGDSREPELAGILGAAAGSGLTLMVTLLLSFPIGVATAVYLEEFAPKTRWVGLIDVSINNLAAVPSIVFGILGLAVFLNFFGLPRSAPLVGGLVLTLMTLPTIIIASRASLKVVPPSIREAALSMGASRMQTVAHHVLPLALPGMLTGAILGMARALGETAPLLMVGMVAFIVEIPKGFTDPATVLPVQIFLWADSPERAFLERASAAILVLLAFLLVMNAAAVYLRRRFQRRW